MKSRLMNPHNQIPYQFQRRRDSRFVFYAASMLIIVCGFTVELMRLDGNITNIFEVTHVYSTDGSAQVTVPVANAQVTNPVTVSGTSVINSSVLGKVVLYDDTYTIVGSSNPIPSPAASGSIGTFSLPVSYHLNAAGMQRGSWHSTPPIRVIFLTRMRW